MMSNGIKMMLLALLFASMLPHISAQQAITITDACGEYSGGHCAYIQTVGTGTVNVVGIENLTYPKQFAPDASVINEPDHPNEGAYAVLLGTNLTIGPFDPYVNKCTNGVESAQRHAVDLYVDGELVENNGWNCNVWGIESCYGGEVCGTRVTDNVLIGYTFLEQGTHHVQLVWDRLNNAMCGGVLEEFDVVVINPVVTVNGSDDQIGIFRRGDTEKDFTLNWTITNTGFDTIEVKYLTVYGCDAAGVTCSFPDFPAAVVDAEDPPEPEVVPPENCAGDVLMVPRPLSPEITTEPTGCRKGRNPGNHVDGGANVPVELEDGETVTLTWESNTMVRKQNSTIVEAPATEPFCGVFYGQKIVTCNDGMLEFDTEPLTMTRVEPADIGSVVATPPDAVADAGNDDERGYFDTQIYSTEVETTGENNATDNVVSSGDTGIGLSEAEVQAILATGTSQTIGLIIDQGESIIVTQDVQLTKPGTVPAFDDFNAHVIIGTAYTLPNLNTESDDEIRLASVFAEKQTFHVELVGGEQRACIGKDGRLGQTGQSAVPRILLSWDWDDIDKNTCSQKGDGDNASPFCDPTQFTISLVKRLNEMHSLVLANQISEASALTRFNVFLMEDNLTQTFRSDFDQESRFGNFFNAPAFYEDPETPWFNYITDDSTLVFTNTTLTAGLYEVDIVVDSDTGPLEFFDNGLLNATIRISLTKVRDPALDSPFYHIPINGGLGGSDYGIQFDTDGAAIPFNADVSTDDSSGGRISITATFADDFEILNTVNRETVLSIDRDLTSIVFAPSHATPIAMVLADNDSQDAEGYYYLSANLNELTLQGNYATLWTGFGSAPMQCQNFDGSSIYYRKDDARAPFGTCVDQSQNLDTFGFSFQDIPTERQNGRVFLETIFYTALGKDVRLHNACRENSATTFSLPNQVDVGNAPIPLAFARSGDTVQEVLAGISNGDLCTSTEDGVFNVWWNPQKLTQALAASKQTLLDASPTPVACQLPPEVINLPQFN
jgi:hypothetical protein